MGPCIFYPNEFGGVASDKKRTIREGKEASSATFSISARNPTCPWVTEPVPKLPFNLPDALFFIPPLTSCRLSLVAPSPLL